MFWSPMKFHFVQQRLITSVCLIQLKNLVETILTTHKYAKIHIAFFASTLYVFLLK